MSKAHILKESTYVTVEGNKLAEKNAQHKILLGHAGHQIPHEHALALGLVEGEKAPEKKEAGNESETKEGGKGSKNKGKGA